MWQDVIASVQGSAPGIMTFSGSSSERHYFERERLIFLACIYGECVLDKAAAVVN